MNLDYMAIINEHERTKAENAELRAKLVVHESVQKHNEKLINSEREKNKKLRELCKQMYPRAKAFLQMGVQLGCNDTLSYDWEQQMRELGVELPK